WVFIRKEDRRRAYIRPCVNNHARLKWQSEIVLLVDENGFIHANVRGFHAEMQPVSAIFHRQSFRESGQTQHGERRYAAQSQHPMRANALSDIHGGVILTLVMAILSIAVPARA